MEHKTVVFLFLQSEYSEETWKATLLRAGCKISEFNTHQMYPDALIPDLAKALSSLTDSPTEDIIILFGRSFVKYFSNFG